MINKNNHYRESGASTRCGNVLNVDGSSRIQTKIITAASRRKRLMPILLHKVAFVEKQIKV